MKRLLALAVCSLLCACPAKEPSLPVVGVLAAASPLTLQMKVGPRGITVGSFLRPEAQLTATGPAVLEFFGGGIHFLDKGETLTVGDAPEKDLVSSNVPQFQVRNGKPVSVPATSRLIIPLYSDLKTLPESVDPKTDLGDYLRGSFVAPAIGSGAGGDLAALAKPPSPFKDHRPRIHAADLGDGGPTAVVKGAFAAAQTDELCTAILLAGRTVDLGRTVRILVPKGSEVVVTPAGQAPMTLTGPGDFRLQR